MFDEKAFKLGLIRFTGQLRMMRDNLKLKTDEGAKNILQALEGIALAVHEAIQEDPPKNVTGQRPKGSEGGIIEFGGSPYFILGEPHKRMVDIPSPPPGIMAMRVDLSKYPTLEEIIKAMRPFATVSDFKGVNAPKFVSGMVAGLDLASDRQVKACTECDDEGCAFRKYLQNAGKIPYSDPKKDEIPALPKKMIDHGWVILREATEQEPAHPGDLVYHYSLAKGEFEYMEVCETLDTSDANWRVFILGKNHQPENKDNRKAEDARSSNDPV
jgi:hypothetical protein